MESSFQQTSTSSQEVHQQISSDDSKLSVPGWNTPADILEQCSAKYDVDRAFDQLVAESETHASKSFSQSMSSSTSTSMVQQTSSSMMQQTSSTSSKTMTTTDFFHILL